MPAAALIATAWHTKKRFRIGLLRQFWQAACLRYSDSRLDPWEYFFFEVYLDRYPMDEKRRFVGWRREILIDEHVNTGPQRQFANDKIAFHAFMHSKGAPVPRVAAIYKGNGQNFPGAVLLNDAECATSYLQDPSNTPFFAKPVRGGRGYGAWAISGPSDDGRMLERTCGSPIGTRDFVSALDAQGEGGYLFQPMLRTHDEISGLSGHRLTSLRIIVILAPTGPEILSAVWRIPTGDNIADNFDVGRSGNIIAGIDLETGRVQRIVRGKHWQNIPIDAHPDTGIRFGDFQLPDWPAAASLCLDCARHFPGLRLQHWDIALTDKGPVILEINVSGGMRTHQIVQQRGIFSERLQILGAR
jgi:hypothetical protein